MRSRVPLLLALFLAHLPACGAASEDDAGAPGPANLPQANAGAVGDNSQAGHGAGSTSAMGGASGGYIKGGASSTTPPATWNSAKSAFVDDTRLENEYAAWKQAHVGTCSNGSSVVINDGEVISSGIAFGMLLSVAMADQPLFDGLWKYYQDHLDKHGLMNWRTSKCEAPGNNNTNAATDADLDATMALVQASARWPTASAGYLAKAEALAAKIAQFETEMCGGRRILRPGDAFGGCSDPIDQRINPAYFSPGYYKVFAHYFRAQAATWSALGDATYQLYAKYQARMANLVPDWSFSDGSDNGSKYGYEACRTPWRVAVDYAWTGDTRAKTFMENISSWVDQHGGLPKAAQQQNSAFVGAFALAGGHDQSKFDGYMAGWLDAQLDDAPYYQGTLRVLYLLVAAGKFSSTL